MIGLGKRRRRGERPADFVFGLLPQQTVCLAVLTRRARVRLALPPSVRVYARLRKAGARGAGARGMISDIGAGGLALGLTEGMRFDVPGEGQEVVLDLDHEGAEAQVRGRVVRSSAQSVSVALPEIARDGDVNGPLFAILARILTREVEHLDRRGHAAALRARLEHERFHGAGYLDVRIAPGWWQFVFLDYVVSWSDGARRLETGAIDRSFAAALAVDPLHVPPSVKLHPEPWPSLLRVVSLIAGQCAAALPDHAATFAAVTRQLRAHAGGTADPPELGS